MLTDPHAEREQAKYEHPVPSRELILAKLRQHKSPIVLSDLAALLNVSGERDLEALRRRVKAMLRDGQLLKNRRDGLLPINEKDLIRGRVTAHPDGFGFLIKDEDGDDLFIPYEEMRKVLHGDRVVVRVNQKSRRGKREAMIVEVLERANHQIVGRLHIEPHRAYVVSDNKRITQDILLRDYDPEVAKEGQMVTVTLLEQPTRRHPPVGKITEVLGEHMSAGMEIDVAIRSFGIPHVWSDDVQQQIEHLSAEVAKKDKKNRLDLRDTPLVTIDGADARDFDDAVFCEATKSGWRLLVAIADVSHYVEAFSALDNDAKDRATSVYFPGRVIPMLPEILSNGLCSLNPDVDRLCMVCELRFDSEGKITRTSFHEGLMRSHARFTYSKVAKILVDKDAELRHTHQALVPHLETLYDLFKVLIKQRKKRGAIEFETTETRIVFDDQRKVSSIVPTRRNDAHRIIEECMISANIAAARFLGKHRMPGLYRVHEPPAAEKVDDLMDFLSMSGLRMSVRKNSVPKAKDYSRIMKQIHGRPDFRLIQTVLLRSLSRAVYSPENLGHFGLGLEEYAHFTSPIRRYPDLLVHRAIRHVLRGGKPKDYAYSKADMVQLGEHCSTNERRADEAVRDVMDWLKCEYMLDKVGQTFTGIITTVTSFGIFVELDDVFVEGLVHITALPKDYYEHDELGQQLVGERTGRIYRVADKVDICVARVSLEDRKIDFEIDRAEVEIKDNRISTRAKTGSVKPASRAKRSGNTSTKRDSKSARSGTDKPTTKSRKKPTTKGKRR